MYKRQGLESSTGFVTVAARTVAESAEKELDKDTTSHGANFAWGFSEGMRSQIDSAISAAREVGNAAAEMCIRDRVLGDNRLPGGREENTLTKDEILKKPYAERAALYAENPDAYNEAMKN